MRKRLFLTALSIGITFCALLWISTFGHMKDTNGADTSLCALTEEQVFAKNVSHRCFLPYKMDVGEERVFGALNLSGIYPLMDFHADGEDILVQVRVIDLFRGNLRIVLLCDGEYIADIPAAEDACVTVENANGDYEIRIAAESATLEVRGSWWHAR